MKNLDRLESRRLLAAIALNNGAIRIIGTNGNDAIIVSLDVDPDFVNFSLNGFEKRIAWRKLTSIQINSNSGNDFISVSSKLANDVFMSLKINAGSGDDNVNVKAFTPESILLGDGNDTFSTTRHSFVYGGHGDDNLTSLISQGGILRGENGNDRITVRLGEASGGDGRDTLVGSGILNGDAENDRIELGYGYANGGTGSDRLISTTDRQYQLKGEHIYARLRGGPGNDHFRASELSEVHGETGNDTIQYYGVPTADDQPNGKIFGDDGNDRIEITGGWNDLDQIVVSGGNGNDFVEGRAAEGGAGNDTVIGTLFYDVLFGGPGDDVIYGGGSSDRLYGEEGNDTLYANWYEKPTYPIDDAVDYEANRDIAYGGPGSDFFDERSDFSIPDISDEDQNGHNWGTRW